MGVKIGGQVEKVNGKELSYSEFVERYLVKNQPVVLTGLMDDWRACKDWVTHNAHPNLQFFSTHFGKSKVQVADCGTREFTDQKRVEMSVSEFVKHWLENSTKESSDSSTSEANGMSVLYLKDWHFVKTAIGVNLLYGILDGFTPVIDEYQEYLAYRTPLIFCDDWLNLYLDNYRMHKDPDTYQKDNEISCSDYRFVYMGAKGSWTPLHADVFRSYSWSANVCGKKKWIFLPPSQCHLVFDRNLKNCVYDIFDDVSETNFPGFKKAIWLECTQEQNEIIFVPSGWYHQVQNLWDLLLRDYNEAKEYIEDLRDICDDFEGLCQRNLAANTGMNFNDFFTFVSRFTLLNVVQLFQLLRDSKNPMRSSSPIAQHLALNLLSIRKIVLKMKCVVIPSGNCKFFVDLRETLDDPEFLKLCMGFSKMYGMIHKLEKWSCDMKKSLMVDLEGYSYLISTVEDLIKLIDYAAGKLSNNCSEENILLSKFDDA
ncbi:hypothetical protein Pint_15500 [Pistacia integerrima]|uniref:Uncharacterized protein n=1 Tax=Pistacia integerrima TaxID=434235 RepID=A0ACC0ZFJ1_9ROSI|nr:hypothetical protein Pint_15500 [Pistacia integerrima]